MISPVNAEERDFITLNPYSEAYLECEELADSTAPIGYPVEHAEWKRVFETCVSAILETAPAAGQVNDTPEFDDIEILEESLMDDYKTYKDDMFIEDSLSR